MSQVTPPPATRVEDVVDVLHGVAVRDPYRWLEDGDADEVRAWSAAQNGRARAVLDGLPGRSALRDRMVELLSVPIVGAPRVAGERLFTVERGGQHGGADADQAVLALRSAVGEPGRPSRVIVDPQALLDDETAALDWFHPSVDGSLVCFGTSVAGDERSTLRVLEVATGELLGDSIPQTRAASVGWDPDGAGFAYTRYPAEGEVAAEDLNYFRRVWWHQLGDDPSTDRLLFDDLPDKTAWTDVSLSRDGRWLLVHVSIGWDRTDVHLRDRWAGDAAPWVSVIEGVDALTSLQVDGERLVGVTTLDAPKGRVVEAPVASPAEWTTLVPEGEAVIEACAVTPRSLLVVSTRTAVSHLHRYGRDGSGPTTEVELPEAGSIGGLSASRERDEAWYSFSSFTRPEQLYRWTGGSPAGAAAWSPAATAVEPERFRVDEHRYPSTDGTPVHLFLVGPAEGDGPRPTVLTGYGGFGITMGPAFSPLAVALADAGGRFAVANIRGGNEEGEEWHRAGQRQHKQQVFDDFSAAAGWLVDEGLTSADQLAIRGGSNGGLLVAATLTQRPDLCRAVHCAVPLTDMVRFPEFLIARLWMPEFGDPDVTEEFAWLHRYSPYHHVDDGTCYPAVLVTTGESDSRVDPCHARKFAARLQAATACGAERPILVRLEERAGHGQGKPIGRQADELADVAAFLWWQLGVPVDHPAVKGQASGVSQSPRAANPTHTNQSTTPWM